METVKSALYMIAGCTLSLVAASVSVPEAAAELFLGMLGPLVAAVTTTVLFERTYRRDPGELTPLMIKAFGAKMVLFGSYVGAVVTFTALSPIPFALSFCASFIALHLTEALVLRSLFAEAHS